MRALALPAAAVGALLLAGCGGGSSGPPVALPVSAGGQHVCSLIPLAVATTMAGESHVFTNGSLARGQVTVCGVYQNSGKKQQVFRVSVLSLLPDSAKKAFAVVGPAVSPADGYRLPASEGYGLVTKGGDGISGRNATAVTTSGDVEIEVTVSADAKGRDPVADARAVLVMLGPQLAPTWPDPPTGIDPANPTSPPPG